MGKDRGALARRLRGWRDDPRTWYRPHLKQMAFHAAGAGHRERMFMAGNRVGKTLAGAAEMAFHLTGLYPDWWQGTRYARPICGWAASVTREATRDILQAAYLGDGTARGVIPKRLIVETVNKGSVAMAADVVKVRHASGGLSVLGFKSYDQGRARFQGTVRDVIHLDEEPDIGIYEECLLRTMTVGGHLMLTMTPLLGLTEMVRHFTETARAEGKALIAAGWNEAPHLAPGAVAALRASLRPHELAAREHGLPQLGRGRVFPVEEDALRCARFEIPATWKRCFGMDFGWSNPTAVVWMAHDPETDTVYVTDCYSRSEATPAEHADLVLRRGAWLPGVCDPAGRSANQRDGVSLLSLYEQAGLRLEPANNDVEAGLMAMLERMRGGRLKVFDDLPEWWHEFRHYSRDEKGRVVKRDDHLLDATRYALVSGLGIARSAAPPPWQRGKADWRTA